MAQAIRDLGNTRQNKTIERLDLRRAEDDDEALRLVMRTEDGRRVLNRFASECNIPADPWDPDSDRRTAFNLGRQSAGRSLMEWVRRVAPDEFIALIGEDTRREAGKALLVKAATLEKDNDDG